MILLINLEVELYSYRLRIKSSFISPYLLNQGVYNHSNDHFPHDYLSCVYQADVSVMADYQYHVMKLGS